MNRTLLLLSLAAATIAHAADDAPVPIIVAAVDIPAGTKVTMEMLSQRGIPKKFATSSIVKPDSVQYLINQPTRRAMLQGDLVLWSSFDADMRIIEACEKKFSGGAADAVEQVRRARAAVQKK